MIDIRFCSFVNNRYPGIYTILTKTENDAMNDALNKIKKYLQSYINVCLMANFVFYLNSDLRLHFITHSRFDQGISASKRINLQIFFNAFHQTKIFQPPEFLTG